MAGTQPNLNGLLDDADGPPYRIRQTAGDGRYEFAELPPGRYLVAIEMDPLVLRNNPELTTRVAVHAVNLGPGEGFAGADFGLRARGGAIEGRTWDDGLANGVRDASEDPLPGLPVALCRFDGLGPGTYRVAFGPSLAGLAFTARDRGLDDASDSDPEPGTGLTEPVTLAAGERRTTVDAGLTGSAFEPVLVAPQLTQVRRLPAGTAIEIEFFAAAGHLYRLQRSESLGPARWQTLGPARVGGGATVTMAADLPPGEPRGFLRVVALRE